jgi:hypothetical protein
MNYSEKNDTKEVDMQWSVQMDGSSSTSKGQVTQLTVHTLRRYSILSLCK